MATEDVSEFCFVHAADLHLDTPFHGLHVQAPHVAAELREASLQAFDAIVELTLSRGAAFLLIAGDVYDGPERGLRAQLHFRAGLARLAAQGIPSFVVHGNHDPVVSGWSAIASWPDGVRVFGSGAVEVHEVLRGGRRIATVQGISYATSATTENLALGFRRPEGEGLHVGLLHCNVAGVADGYANYSPCTLEDLRRTGLDYLALGHIHQRRVLAGAPGAGPYVVYPGNSQARSPRRSEQEPKGALVVHVTNGEIAELEFVACDRVRFNEVPVSIEHCQDLVELDEVLDAAEHQALLDAGGRSVVLRARLEGHGPLHRDLTRPGLLGELLTTRRSAAPTAPPFCWWDSLIDRTRASLDLEEISRRGDFAADLLRLAEDLLADEDAGSALLEQLLDGAPRALVEAAAPVLKDAERRVDVLLRAQLLALEQVVEG